MCLSYFGRLALGAALASLANAHPAFRGRILSRDTDLLSSYDYVVVGGGASGLTVANRLTEDSNVTVLIIEAGELDHGEDFITIPGLAGGAIGTKYDWNLTYVANPSLANRSVSIPQGKIVGGGTKLNRMVFDRGSELDYDRWEALGNSGWGWSSLLPYFKKSEIFTPPNADIVAEYNITTDTSVHGTDGYVHSSYSPFIWPTMKNFVAAIAELGIFTSVDGASGNAYGAYFTQHSQNPANATRSSARDAYYNNFVARSNLHLITSRQVTKLVTSSENGSVTVTGVEFAESSASARSTVSANMEVIMAAGALHTPQILQLSGIGDSTLLSSINVTTIVDLPAVGRNLQDHVLLAVVNSITAPLTAANLTSNATYAAEMLALYESEYTGPYACATGDFLAFLPVSTYSTAGEAIYAEATTQDSSTYLASDTPSEVLIGYEAQFNLLNQDLLADNSAMLEVLWDDGAYILGLQHPYSRGYVKAASSDPFTAPLLDSAFLHNPLDLALLVEGVKFTRNITRTSAIAALSPVEILPGATVTTDAALEDFVRSNAATVYHPVGTCKMGAQAEGGVVDEELKVYGVNGLRVVDASIFPLLPATHIQSTVYAVAEKAANIIKGSDITA
ncbi:related to alcohol oxidase [Phialocephala subalpina]|uniref:Related to alcohol oxidase n=1 Tax=Phialocephala subalpina TaxID=576137 RepID=A0A1L7XSP0_9HELO|nr:related to alcohol oxidase [Phialocephala subalpina]